jgi:hypothetical protein
MHMSWRHKALIAVIGDCIVLLAFAAIGRSAHGDTDNGPLVGTLATSAPFLAGWFAAALALGVYARPTLFSFKASALRAAAAWIGGGAIGLAIRSAQEGRIVPVGFIAVALSFNLVWLTAWHVLLALLPRRRPFLL